MTPIFLKIFEIFNIDVIDNVIILINFEKFNIYMLQDTTIVQAKFEIFNDLRFLNFKIFTSKV